MIYYTSDLHFGHKNVINFDNRPFASVEEMDEELIKRWNETVGDDDVVYIIGDVCMRRRGGSAAGYISRLSGKKHLIIGNHDGVIVNSPKAMALFESVSDIKRIKDGGRDICLCHYPLAEWPGYYRGSLHIYGHIHNNRNEAYEIMRHKERALNAGCMLTDYRPVTLDELVRYNESYRGV